MSETPATTSTDSPKKRSRKSSLKDAFKHGLYTPLFTPEEIRYLDAGPVSLRDEMNLLRIKVLRLAKLTPLKKIDTKELDTVIKLIRVVAMLDAIERTGIMRSKVEGTSPLLDALDDLDPDDL